VVNIVVGRTVASTNAVNRTVEVTVIGAIRFVVTTTVRVFVKPVVVVVVIRSTFSLREPIKAEGFDI
jgi:hypothetical protein